MVHISLSCQSERLNLYTAFNHSTNNSTEQEYDRLRNLARQEHGKRSSCSDRSRQAYDRGDGAAAHELSEEGKRHGAMAEQYNKQASDFIFRENNAPGRVADDTIDLHGQFVEEAQEIIEARIRYAQSRGQTHLHVIVGKGNHSVDHIQKIKPRVEQVCRDLNLQYATEENEGRIYVNLQGGPANMPPSGGYGGQQHHQQHGHGGHQQGPHQGYQPQQGYGGQQQQQGGQNQNNEIEQMAMKLLPRILRKLEQNCCIVM